MVPKPCQEWSMSAESGAPLVVDLKQQPPPLKTTFDVKIDLFQVQ